MAMKDKKKVICILVAAILILCTGICSYRLGQTSIETPEKYLQTHFTEPQVHYSKELVTVSSGNYLIVFYYNDSHTIVAAVLNVGTGNIFSAAPQVPCIPREKMSQACIQYSIPEFRI